MEKINEALVKIESVLKATKTFQCPVSSGDFEGRYNVKWPDIDGGMAAVNIVREELQKIKTV